MSNLRLIDSGDEWRVGSSPTKTTTTFTLAQLRDFMAEFLHDMETRGHVTTYGAGSLTDWKFETFLQWLQTKSKENSDE